MGSSEKQSVFLEAPQDGACAVRYSVRGLEERVLMSHELVGAGISGKEGSRKTRFVHRYIYGRKQWARMG